MYGFLDTTQPKIFNYLLPSQSILRYLLYTQDIILVLVLVCNLQIFTLAIYCIVGITDECDLLDFKMYVSLIIITHLVGIRRVAFGITGWRVN